MMLPGTVIEPADSVTLLAVSEPDSRKGPKDTEEFKAVDDYRTLIKGLE